MSQELWDSWRRLARILESGTIAFRNERERVMQLDQPRGTIDEAVGDSGRYRVTHAEHCAALADESTFYSAALIQYYALAEATALDNLNPPTNELTGGIESWGGDLLERVGKGFADLVCRPSPHLSLWKPSEDAERNHMKGSLALKEVGLVRNLIVHNGLRVTEKTISSLMGAGREPSVVAGQQLALSLTDVRVFKGRLATLLNVAGFQVDDDAYRPPRQGTQDPIPGRQH